MNVELQKKLDEHVPLAIFPMGLGSKDLARVISEGFLFQKGLVFFDVGWNAPMAGTGTEHFVLGETSGPFSEPLPGGEYRRPAGYVQFWKVGEAYIFELTNERMENGVDLYRQAVLNRERQEGYRDDKYRGRTRAEEIAKQIAEKMNQEAR